MKRCPSCGAELKDSATFCFVCGVPVGGGAISDKEAEKMRREMALENHVSEKSHVGRTIVAAFFVALFILIVGYAWLSPGLDTLHKIRMGDVSQAEKTYKSKVNGTVLEMFTVRTLAPATADLILKDYNRERIGYVKAEDELGLLKKLEYPANKTESRLDSLAAMETSKRGWVRGEKLDKAGQYEKAMTSYAMVDEEDVHYKTAQSRAETTATKYKKQILKETEDLKTGKDYEQAISVLEAAKKVLPQDQDFSDRLSALKQQYSSILKSETLSTARRYIQKGYYKQAMEMAKQALTYNPNDLELQNLQTTAQNDYENFARDQVAIYIDNKDYKGAMELMNRVRRDLPDDAVIDQLYETTKASKSLCES